MQKLSSNSHFQEEFPAMLPRLLPGSIHEGGELGYSLSHAFGAAFDNPDLIVACVVGDGEAETGFGDGMAVQQISRSGERRSQYSRSSISTATK